MCPGKGISLVFTTKPGGKACQESLPLAKIAKMITLRYNIL